MLSQSQVNDLDHWLRAVRESPRQAFAIFRPEDRPGKPWDEHAVLDDARVLSTGFEMRYFFAGKPIDLRVHGIEAVTPEAHAWSTNALRLSGNIQCEQRCARSSFPGWIRPSFRRLGWQCTSFLLVAQT